MDYAGFKEHLVTFLWKKGDTVLIDALDSLIKMGEAKLNRDFKVERRHTSVNLLLTSDKVALPDNYYSILQVTDYDTQLGEFKYVSPGELEGIRSKTASTAWAPYYSIEGKSLLLCGPVASSRQTVGPVAPSNPSVGDLWVRTTVSPGLYVWEDDGDSTQWVQLQAVDTVDAPEYDEKRLVVHYMATVPNFQSDNTSWIADEQLDLLTYSVLWHTAPFLREDERVQVWQGYYKDALDAANDSSAFEQSRGVYGAMRLPRPAGVHRRSR
jgi:hypothetical protein